VVIVVAGNRPHYEGEREVVDWTRPDGQTYRNVPVVYLRRVTASEYLAQHPHVSLAERPDCRHFWEVSVD
jgi:hypothetical protein